MSNLFQDLIDYLPTKGLNVREGKTQYRYGRLSYVVRTSQSYAALVSTSALGCR